MLTLMSENVGPLTAKQQTHITVMILSCRTDRSGQTVQTQIRLLLEESDQGLHYLLFHLHLLEALLCCKAIFLEF